MKEHVNAENIIVFVNSWLVALPAAYSYHWKVQKKPPSMESGLIKN